MNNNLSKIIQHDTRKDHAVAHTHIIIIEKGTERTPIYTQRKIDGEIRKFTFVFENELTHPSSNFIVVGILSATNNVWPKDGNALVIAEKC